MKRDVMGQTAIDGVEGLNRAGELGEIDGFTGSRQLMWGHVLLLVCAVLYLIWWCIFFRPNAQVKGGALRVFGIACILVAAVAGIAGVVLECFGISKLSALPTLSAAAGRARSVWIWPFAVGGVAAYVILAVLTSRLLQRPITTELLLIVMWITLELCALTMLHSSGALGATAAIVLAIILLILLIADMACYLAYYHLLPMPAFVDGTAPLIAVAVFSAIVVALLV